MSENRPFLGIVFFITANFLTASVNAIAKYLSMEIHPLLVTWGYFVGMTVFVIGYVLIYVFSLKFGWFPVQGYKAIGDGFLPFLRSIALPTIALGVVYVALIARISRASMLEVLNEDYIRTARAKGQVERKVMMRHALKNAAVPIITIIGIGIALLIGGVVVTESVFNIPGLGRLTIDAVLRRDYPIIQGVILVFSAAYVIVNLLIDISYSFLDPRIRY